MHFIFRNYDYNSCSGLGHVDYFQCRHILSISAGPAACCLPALRRVVPYPVAVISKDEPSCSRLMYSAAAEDGVGRCRALLCGRPQLPAGRSLPRHPVARPRAVGFRAPSRGHRCLSSAVPQRHSSFDESWNQRRRFTRGWNFNYRVSVVVTGDYAVCVEIVGLA